MHLLRSRPCSQRPLPPQSLHLLRCRPCSHFLRPIQLRSPSPVVVHARLSEIETCAKSHILLIKPTATTTAGPNHPYYCKRYSTPKERAQKFALGGCGLAVAFGGSPCDCPLDSCSPEAASSSGGRRARSPRSPSASTSPPSHAAAPVQAARPETPDAQHSRRSARTPSSKIPNGWDGPDPPLPLHVCRCTRGHARRVRR